MNPSMGGRAGRDEEHTKGIGIMAVAIKANSVFAHLYVSASYICWVKRGKAIPARFPVDVLSVCW